METFLLVEFWESHLRALPMMAGGFLLLMGLPAIRFPWFARTPSERRTRSLAFGLLALAVLGPPIGLYTADCMANGPPLMAVRVDGPFLELRLFPWPLFRRIPLSEVSAVMAVRNEYSDPAEGTWSLWLKVDGGRWLRSPKGGRRLPVLVAAKKLAGLRGIDLRWARQFGYEEPRPSDEGGAGDITAVETP